MPRKSTPVVLGNARFTVYTPGCVRIEYADRGQFSPFPSMLVGAKPARPARADVVLRTSSVRIKTDRFELFYQDDGQCFSCENLKIVHRGLGGHRTVWVPGKRDAGNLGTVRRSLDQWRWCGGPENHPVEGILSTEGGHFLPDEPRVYWNTDDDWPECMSQRVAFDGYFFAYGDDFKQALKDFVTVFGPIPMVPRWAFGFWYSRWYAYTENEIVALVKEYRKHRVPLDVMVIDTDWRDGWGGYDWSKKYFPHPARMFRRLHDMGLHAGLNDHPGYNAYDSLPQADSHKAALAKRIGPLPHQGQWACDWSRKEAVEAWRDILLGPFFDQGMDFWWVDGWLKAAFGNSDSQLWANRQYYELAQEKTGKRGLILSRWGGIGSHRYPVQFSGDTKSHWGVLQHQIEFTARSAGLGAVYWSHDIGGFMGREIDEELFIRWSQFGAMSPVFRTHSDHGKREPWKFSRKALEIFRRQTRIRCALAPYFYTLAREAHDTGLPIVRPTYLEYNRPDGGALDRRHQYLIGRDLLVIPADGPADKHTGLFRKRAYFPPYTRWYALETGEVLEGWQDRWIDIPLALIPTYVREGAILPAQRVGEAIGTAVPEEMHFDYYPDPLRPSAFELYEDDGESMEHEKGRCARTLVTGRRTADEIVMTIARPRGSYRGMPKKRTYVVRVLLRPGERVLAASAKVGGDPRRALKHRMVKSSLAGEAVSGHAFCQLEVKSRNEAVRVSMKVE